MLASALLAVAASQVAAPDVPVDGRPVLVVDPDGEPVAGARLEHWVMPSLAPYEPNDISDGFELLSTLATGDPAGRLDRTPLGVSDGEGNATVDCGRDGWLVADSGTQWGYVRLVDAIGEPTRLVVLPDDDFVIRVVDPEGRPWADAPVTLWKADYVDWEYSRWGYSSTGLTDARGTARFPHRRTLVEDLFGTGPGFDGGAFAYVGSLQVSSPSVFVHPSVERSSPVELVTPPGAFDLELRFTWYGGEPYEGPVGAYLGVDAAAHFRTRRENLTAGSVRYSRLQGAEGRLPLGPCEPHVTSQVNLYYGDAWRGAERDRPLAAPAEVGDGVRVIRLPWNEAPSLRARAVDVRGEPLIGATLWLDWIAGSRRSPFAMTTDANGEFDIRLPGNLRREDGLFELEIECREQPGFGELRVETTFELPPEGELAHLGDLRFAGSDSPSSSRGRDEDEDTDAGVVLEGHFRGLPLEWTQAIHVRTTSAWPFHGKPLARAIDRTGTFRIPWETDEGTNLFVWDQERRQRSPIRFEPPPPDFVGTWRPPSLQGLEWGSAPLVLEVVDCDGHLVPHAYLCERDADGEWDSVANGHGRFQLDPSFAGRELVVFANPRPQGRVVLKPGLNRLALDEELWVELPLLGEPPEIARDLRFAVYLYPPEGVFGNGWMVDLQTTEGRIPVPSFGAHQLEWHVGRAPESHPASVTWYGVSFWETEVVVSPTPEPCALPVGYPQVGYEDAIERIESGSESIEERMGSRR